MRRVQPERNTESERVKARAKQREREGENRFALFKEGMMKLFSCPPRPLHGDFFVRLLLPNYLQDG